MKLEITNPYKISEVNPFIWFDKETDTSYIFKHIESGIITHITLTKDSNPNGGRYRIHCGKKGMVVDMNEIKDLNTFVKKLIYIVEWKVNG